MTRLERVILWSMSVVVFGAAVSVLFRGLPPAPSAHVRAAEDRVVLLDSNKLDVLRRAVAHAHNMAESEFRLADGLQKKGVAADKQRMMTAYGRSNDWRKIETSLRALFMTEVDRMLKESDVKYRPTGGVRTHR
jgi:hypothetical protein